MCDTQANHNSGIVKQYSNNVLNFLQVKCAINNWIVSLKYSSTVYYWDLALQFFLIAYLLVKILTYEENNVYS